MMSKHEWQDWLFWAAGTLSVSRPIMRLTLSRDPDDQPGQESVDACFLAQILTPERKRGVAHVTYSALPYKDGCFLLPGEALHPDGPCYLRPTIETLVDDWHDLGGMPWMSQSHNICIARIGRKERQIGFSNILVQQHLREIAGALRAALQIHTEAVQERPDEEPYRYMDALRVVGADVRAQIARGNKHYRELFGSLT